MSKRIALIDADGILYAAALNGETPIGDNGEVLQLLPLEVIYRNALSRIEEQVGWAKAEDAFIILSDRRNFRTDILKPGMIGSPGKLGYKGQRKASARPKTLDGLRNLMTEEAPYKVMLIKGLEADDVCGIAAGQLQKAGNHTVVVSPDKDLLQIPGEVCTPYRNGRGPLKRMTSVVTEESANHWHQAQTLQGDTCDNYSGCPGWGPSNASYFLDACYGAGLTQAEIWEEIVQCFLMKGLTREDCLVQAQVSRILRLTDWDAEKKEPILFQFPTA
jgi:hypothetical protein